jgi:YidC/Oxa1 family membrane protein insertase
MRPGPRRWRRARPGSPLRLLLGLLFLGCAIAGPVSGDEREAERVRVTTDHLDLGFSREGADIRSWVACYPSCAEGTSVRLAGEDDPPPVRVILRGAGPPVDLDRLRFSAHPTADAPAQGVVFESDLPAGGGRIAKSFEVSRGGYEVVMVIRLLGPRATASVAGRHLEVELEPGPGLFPAPAAGFSAALDRVRRVVVAGGGIRVLEDRGQSVALRAGEWAGIRSRFWALLVRPDEPGTVVPRPGGTVALVAADEPGRLAWRYTLYSGPLERAALGRTDPELERLLFAGLWWWLRALSLGLLTLLRGLTAIIRQPGVAIIALAVSVKILLLPLTTVAQRLQDQVNATQAKLQPGIDAINAAHRGEERLHRTLALYREAGVHPLYTLRSLVGLLIQLPVFIAVFDMLAEDFDLYRASFLWIPDLSRPDGLLRLPGCLPFVGCQLNLLPFLMSGVSLATLLRFRPPGLTAALVRRQRRNLMGMTLAFFLLFYTFPAGMVLYWTSTNAFQLVSQELGRWRRARRTGGVSV